MNPSRPAPIAAPVAPQASLTNGSSAEPTFLYFAYGSCMCPVDLQRTLGEPAYPYLVGTAMLEGYRLGFNWRSPRRECGVLDVVPDARSRVFGVLYALPWRLSDQLDDREDVPRGGYRRETITVTSQGQTYRDVRTYVVVDKLTRELAPNDWYFTVVMRGATTCGLPEEYCWKLFHHMAQLQRQHHHQYPHPHPHPYHPQAS